MTKVHRFVIGEERISNKKRKYLGRAEFGASEGSAFAIRAAICSFVTLAPAFENGQLVPRQGRFFRVHWIFSWRPLVRGSVFC
ncbi:hypothetical protein BDW_04635 [Bdellovibrio bacteriovorus W]|nr:hypothetical protein BDW_04635 [Bdellovibrio bacteriovorus W]